MDGDKDEKAVKGPDSAMLVVEWTSKQWKEFVQKVKKDGVTEDDYASARAKIPCDHHPMSDAGASQTGSKTFKESYM